MAVTNSNKPTFFPTQASFRKWLLQNHKNEKELLVGFYKIKSGKLSIRWSQSVDGAICFGWLDGIRKSIDDTSYCIRFTPRKSTSIWSAINIKKVEDLTQKGLMYPAGIAAYSKRKEHNSRIYSYENEGAKLPQECMKKFKANKRAWRYFQTMAPSYQKTAIHWVMDAKQEITKMKRLDELMTDSESERKIKRLNY